MTRSATTTMIYRCTSCDKLINEHAAHVGNVDDLLRQLQQSRPDLWPPLIGPEQLYHKVYGYHYVGARGCYGGSVPFTKDCGPLRHENEGDKYIDWALSAGNRRM